MNRQPYSIPPRRWSAHIDETVIRLSRSWRRRRLRREVRFDEIQVHNAQTVRRLIDDGSGVLIVSNHSAHYDSEAIYYAMDTIQSPLHIMTAWQVFQLCKPWEVWFMNRTGCFSIDREGNDRQALKEAIQILQTQTHPLLIFPEGDVYHTNDRVNEFREGAAAIAQAAAKKSDRDIFIVPCAAKFRYLSDPTPSLNRVLEKLEQRLTLRPRSNQSFVERIYRLGEAVLSLKELEYLGTTVNGEVNDRIVGLAEHILTELETEHQVKVTDNLTPVRVKNLRQAIIEKTNQPSTQNSPEKLKRLFQQMDDLFLVTQLYSYRPNYIQENPTRERVAETIDKLEEDILRADLPTVHGSRRVDIFFGDPIAVPKTRARDSIERLTTQSQQAVQQLLDRANEEFRTKMI